MRVRLLNPQLFPFEVPFSHKPQDDHVSFSGTSQRSQPPRSSNRRPPRSTSGRLCGGLVTDFLVQPSSQIPPTLLILRAAPSRPRSLSSHSFATVGLPILHASPSRYLNVYTDHSPEDTRSSPASRPVTSCLHGRTQETSLRHFTPPARIQTTEDHGASPIRRKQQSIAERGVACALEETLLGLHAHSA